MHDLKYVQKKKKFGAPFKVEKLPRLGLRPTLLQTEVEGVSNGLLFIMMI